MYRTICDCKKCIYREACPCGYHTGNAACVTFYQQQTKEMLLHCLSSAASPLQAWEALREYLRGYGELQTDVALSVAQIAPPTVEQLQVLHMREDRLQAVIAFLELTKTQDLTAAEYAVLLALLP